MLKPLVAQAITALRNEDYVAARACMVSYGEQNPLELQHYLIRGLAELSLKEWKDGMLTFAHAAVRYPNEASVWLNLGIAQENLGDLKNAALSYERSLRLRPDDAETCGNLSNVYCRMGRFAEAETLARYALEFGASKAQGHNSLGLALNRQNKFAEAEAAFRAALQAKPDSVFALTNLANLAVDQLDFSTAGHYFAQARAASGDAPLIRHHEGMARLLAGDYENGWKLCEARLDVPGGLRVTPPCPRWQGEALAGKTLLLVAEQGFGDLIQFCRYAALLKDAQLVWVVPKNLQKLLADNLPGRVITETDVLPRTDFYVPILSLPLALQKWEPKDAPAAPYLRAPQSPIILAPSERKIGLVWSGSPTHERDFERSIPFALLTPLIKNSAATFYAPFTGAGLEQIGTAPVLRLDEQIKDFADTAGLLAQMDAVITVDTAVAHLAGALGVKTYLLLPFCPDWRWGTMGTATVWYPSVTLIRQPKAGDWAAIMARLNEYLTANIQHEVPRS